MRKFQKISKISHSGHYKIWKPTRTCNAPFFFNVLSLKWHSTTHQWDQGLTSVQRKKRRPIPVTGSTRLRFCSVIIYDLQNNSRSHYGFLHGISSVEFNVGEHPSHLTPHGSSRKMDVIHPTASEIWCWPAGIKAWLCSQIFPH